MTPPKVYTDTERLEWLVTRGARAYQYSAAWYVNDGKTFGAVSGPSATFRDAIDEAMRKTTKEVKE